MKVELNGLKITRQRKLLIDYLEQLPEHKQFSAEDVYIKLHSELTLATIYRNLELFCEHHVLRKTLSALNNRAMYEVITHEHIHRVVCTYCGKMVTLANCPLEEYTRSVEKNTGFKVFDHRLELVGICEDCNKATSVLPVLL